MLCAIHIPLMPDVDRHEVILDGRLLDMHSVKLELTRILSSQNDIQDSSVSDTCNHHVVDRQHQTWLMILIRSHFCSLTLRSNWQRRWRCILQERWVWLQWAHSWTELHLRSHPRVLWHVWLPNINAFVWLSMEHICLLSSQATLLCSLHW